CLFLVIYFIYLFIMEKRSFSMVWKFALGSLLAGGLAAIMLVPVVRALMATDFGDMVFPKNWKVYFPILDVLARHCMAIKTERALAHWPNIYSGVLTFLLVPMYAVNEKISAKKRFGTLAIEGILLICFCTNFLDYIWHGLNYPDSLPARQSFIYVLFMVMMCYECFVHWDGVNKGMILRVYLGSVAFLLFIEKFVDVDDFAPWTWHLNFAFITFYAICMYLFKTKKGKTIYVLAGLVLLVTVAEATGNMLYTSVGVTKRTDATKLMDDYNTLYERNLAKTQEEGFQRYDKIFHVTKNDGVYGSYPSASVFSSTLNSYVMDLYTKIGLQYSKVYYGASGITPLTAAMLNLKYIYLESDQWENEMLHLIDQENEVYLYEMNYSLPFGYVAPKGFDLPDGVNDYGVTLLNKLAKDLGAYDAMLVKEDTKEDGDDVIFTVPKDGIYYGYTTNHGTGKIKMIGGGKEDTSYKDLRKGVLFYLGSLEADQQYTFTNGDSKDDTKKISMAIYRLNLDAAEIAINTLKKQSMTDVVIDNCNVSGKLELEEAGRLILSIPVDEGWTVWVNGVETEPASFGNALIALDLEPGSYDIRLEFEASGKIMGRVISAITLVIVMLLFGLPFLRERLGKKKEAESEKS
ncbi:MAG: YfhO family protein, partial [Lachnospiraceae bacterium]|nr:YfhO family protein [Lachnospiraceae bacterium]